MIVEVSEKIEQLKIEPYVKFVLLKIAQRTEHRVFSVNTDHQITFTPLG